MDKYILTIVIVGVLLVLGGALLVVRKFFFKFLKYYVISAAIFMIGSGLYVYRVVTLSKQVRVKPAVGKHAYMSQSGMYLGVVEGSAYDKQRGQVWIVRPPGGYPVIYSKSRVTLKDKKEP